MIKTGLIGCGAWGRVVYKKLKIISNVVFICTSSDDYISKIESVNWVFVVTPNETHYDIVTKCLTLGKNVFCEKPLTLTFAQSKELYGISKKYNARLYVDDVQRYTNSKYHLKTHNFIERMKNSAHKYQERDLLYRLAYHDIYMVYNDIKNLNINDIKIISKHKNLNFSVLFEQVTIDFFYDVEYKGRAVHNINGISLIEKKQSDPLLDMLSMVLNESADFDKNKEISLFANYIIDKVNEKL